MCQRTQLVLESQPKIDRLEANLTQCTKTNDSALQRQNRCTAIRTSSKVNPTPLKNKLSVIHKECASTDEEVANLVDVQLQFRVVKIIAAEISYGSFCNCLDIVNEDM